MDYKQIIAELKSLKNPGNVAGMARFGINPENTLGIPIPVLRKLAKKLGENHNLAQQLWDSGIHDAKVLASMIDDPKLVTEKQMDEWVVDFDSWDVCDQVCMNLFDKTPFAFQKAAEWAKREEPARIAIQNVAGGEFEKRAGFALIACLAWHDKQADDREFMQFFPLIKEEGIDERNFVKKAVNWALRQIGKRNENLRKLAIGCAQEIEKIDSKSARWIAKDVLRELTKRKN